MLLPATLTTREARDTLRMLAQGLQREPGTEAVVNAGGLQHFDSAALAVLLECQRLAQAWGKRFSIRQAPPKLIGLARLYGVDSLLMAGDEALPP
ncbi:MAG: STAS domain-containing protein [Pseudomonadota bacterium]|nr:STAS domain-containing protein [Pseudomonadota bacterium]